MRDPIHSDVAAGADEEVEMLLCRDLILRPAGFCLLADGNVRAGGSVGVGRARCDPGEVDGLAAVVLEGEPSVVVGVPELCDAARGDGRCIAVRVSSGRVGTTAV